MRHDSDTASKAAPMWCWVAFICASLLGCQISSAQAVRRRDTTWVSPTAIPIRLNGYEVKEATERDGARRIYIRRGVDTEWMPFYVNERYLLVTLGNRKRAVLMNDCPATKFCKVVVVDLASHTSNQIDQRAIEMYRRHAHPDDRLIIVPQAYSFSPDDRQALINMELIHISVAAEPRELVERLNRSYRNWWYVVDSSTGRVLREYRTNQIPKRWWAS